MTSLENVVAEVCGSLGIQHDGWLVHFCGSVKVAAQILPMSLRYVCVTGTKKNSVIQDLAEVEEKHLNKRRRLLKAAPSDTENMLSKVADRVPPFPAIPSQIKANLASLAVCDGKTSYQSAISLEPSACKPAAAIPSASFALVPDQVRRCQQEVRCGVVVAPSVIVPGQLGVFAAKNFAAGQFALRMCPNHASPIGFFKLKSRANSARFRMPVRC